MSDASRIEYHLRSQVHGLSGHWRVRAARVKREREMGVRLVRMYKKHPAPPWILTITRVAPRALDDDNLAYACKAIRDGIAEALGFRNDADWQLVWRYAQRKGKPREYAIELVIASAEWHDDSRVGT